MRVYITDLKAYSCGHLVGEWLIKSVESVLSEGKKVCGSVDEHEEIFLSDYEADIKIAEYENIYSLNDRAEVLESYSEDEALKLKLLAYEGYSEKEVIDTGIDSYDIEIYDFRGDSSFKSVFELLAEKFIDDGLYGEIAEGLGYYLNYEAMARDLSMDYCEFESGVVGRVL